MRRLLLIAYYFPPETAAGALRPSYLTAYLREYGWDVTVLTRPLNGERTRDSASGRVVTAPVLGDSVEQSVRGAFGGNGETSGRGARARVRSALRWARRTLSFPDRAVGWAPAAVARGCALAREQRFDAILSTATPATAHLVGGTIACCFGLPWVADYRDPWTGNPGANEGPVRTRLQLGVERFLLRRAAAITTISDAIASRLKSIHRRPIAVIPNAAEPADWAGLESVQPTEFQLCYTGVMFAERSPALLFEALASLRAQGDPAGNARVVFYGKSDEHVMEQARRHGVADIVEHRGVVPRDQALAAQRKSSDLLIFLNMDESSVFELGSKIIEYTQARRPILAFGPSQSVMRSHLARHRLGWFASNLEEARVALRAAYEQFMAGNLELPQPNGFAARDLAKAFADQLEAVV